MWNPCIDDVHRSVMVSLAKDNLPGGQGVANDFFNLFFLHGLDDTLSGLLVCSSTPSIPHSDSLNEDALSSRYKASSSSLLSFAFPESSQEAQQLLRGRERPWSSSLS